MKITVRGQGEVMNESFFKLGLGPDFGDDSRLSC